MSAIANTLGVSRSNLVRSMKGDLVVRRQRYHKECDKDLLPAIQKLVSHRPTYGYRRITAVLNRERALEGLPPVNHKRCYRIMEQNNLLLTRYTGKRVKRASTGKVVTLHSNTRKVRTLFSKSITALQILSSLKLEEHFLMLGDLGRRSKNCAEWCWLLGF